MFENMGVKLLSNLTLLYCVKSCVYFLISYAILEYCSLPLIYVTSVLHCKDF